MSLKGEASTTDCDQNPCGITSVDWLTQISGANESEAGTNNASSQPESMQNHTPFMGQQVAPGARIQRSTLTAVQHGLAA